jgi:hypothetical protein
MTFTDRNADFRDSVDNQVVRDQMGLHLVAFSIGAPALGLIVGLVLDDVLAGFITGLVFALIWGKAEIDEGIPPISPYNPFEDFAPNDPIGTNPFGPLHDKMEKDQ